MRLGSEFCVFSASVFQCSEELNHRSAEGTESTERAYDSSSDAFWESGRIHQGHSAIERQSEHPMNKRIVALLLIAIISTGGCSQIMGMPALDIEIQSFNEELQIICPSAINSFQIGQDIDCVVQAIGDRPIQFAPDLNVMVFVFKDGNWQRVDLVPTTYPDGEFTLFPSFGVSLSSADLFVYPILDKPATGPALLRIIVWGLALDDMKQTGERVGAYVDVELRP